jgi:hypothetical protein
MYPAIYVSDSNYREGKTAMNAILLKDERSELEFFEAILGAHGPSICRAEEIIRNKREANHRKWEAKLRRANGCHDQVDDDAWLNKEPIQKAQAKSGLSPLRRLDSYTNPYPMDDYGAASGGGVAGK